MHPLHRVRRVPRKCVWELTRRCNLSCVHCENESGPASESELPLARMLEVAEELAHLGCQHVDLSGGEPLLSPAWQPLAARLSHLGIGMALVTNGTLLSAETLQQVVAAGIGRISVSLDGLGSTHDAVRSKRARGLADGAWHAAVAGLRRAVHHLPCTVITQVTRANLDELPELGRWLRDEGVERWQLTLAVPAGRLRTNAERLVLCPEHLEPLAAHIERMVRDRTAPTIDVADTIGYYTDRELALRGARGGLWLGCQGGIRRLAITYAGRVRACSVLPAELDAGDLHGESLTTIWRDEKRFELTTRFSEERLRGACARCQFGAVCRGGCPTMAYFASGLLHDNPYCLLRVRREAERDGERTC